MQQDKSIKQHLGLFFFSVFFYTRTMTSGQFCEKYNEGFRWLIRNICTTGILKTMFYFGSSWFKTLLQLIGKKLIILLDFTPNSDNGQILFSSISLRVLLLLYISCTVLTLKVKFIFPAFIIKTCLRYEKACIYGHFFYVNYLKKVTRFYQH